jgi:hypothetical protein
MLKRVSDGRGRIEHLQAVYANILLRQFSDGRVTGRKRGEGCGQAGGLHGSIMP